MKHVTCEYVDYAIAASLVFFFSARVLPQKEFPVTLAAMLDIEVDVDMLVFEEEEETLMREAELEHLQNEAEIALNTRWNGDRLQPYFGDDEQMLTEIPPNDEMIQSRAAETVHERNDGRDAIAAWPFSVMTRALWDSFFQTMMYEDNTQVDDDDPTSGLS